MSKPPWRKEAEPLFTEDRTDRGNKAEAHKLYANHKWRSLSAKFFKGYKCEANMCISMAAVTDHIIPISMGGSQYDRRNWQRLCTTHHNRKSAKESRGVCEESVDTPAGKIPKRREHLPPDIAGQTYMVQ